jgi:hypothetical protein
MKRFTTKHTTHWLDHVEDGVIDTLNNKELERLRLIVVDEEYVRRHLEGKPRKPRKPA